MTSEQRERLADAACDLIESIFRFGLVLSLGWLLGFCQGVTKGYDDAYTKFSNGVPE